MNDNNATVTTLTQFMFCNVTGWLTGIHARTSVKRTQATVTALSEPALGFGNAKIARRENAASSAEEKDCLGNGTRGLKEDDQGGNHAAEDGGAADEDEAVEL